jgi:copper oxidase (laccase) domain-containing protein
VGADVRTAFVQADHEAQALFTPCGHEKWLANLQGLARRRLAALGITQVYGNDGSREWCIASQPSRFFSHRRDGVSGRMAACIWLD